MTTGAIISAIVGIVGVVIGVVGYFGGQRKQSNDEVQKRAYFEGEIKAKLDQVITTLEKLENKLSKNTDELYTEISKQIAEHEKRYHK